jgi:tetratricopeptide (TPR) repeat protein
VAASSPGLRRTALWRRFKLSGPHAPPQRSDASADPETTLNLALARRRAGARDEAEQLYRQVLDAHPGDARALYLCGLLNFEMGRMEEAERLLLKLAEVRPDDPEAHIALADLARSLGRQDQAIGAYRRALAIAPSHPVALQHLAALILQRGFVDEADFGGAIDVCQAAIGLLPDPAPAHAVLGRILLASGRYEEAAAALRAALALAPANLAARAGLAQALLGAGESEAALAEADAAAALGPNDHDAWFARGAALAALHRPEAAASAFERAVALAPDHARTLMSLGAAYAELDRMDEALAFLSYAAELDPGSSAAQANLGSAYYHRGELEKAAHHLRLALAAEPGLVAAHRNLAGVYADLGDPVQARRHRDAAFGLCNVFVERAARPRARVLVLTTSESGNVPHRYLLPPDRYTRIDWFIEYAREGQAAALPPYDVVFNIIGDPDFADATEAPVAAFVQAYDGYVLNHPAKAPPTRRDRLPTLLAGIEGLAIPKVARLDAADIAAGGLAAAVTAAGLTPPVLIRPIGSHGGRGLTVAHTLAELEAVDTGPGEGAYATEFVDFRSPADSLYRKYRVIFVDRRPYPYHLAIANHWLVHYATAEMPDDGARQAEEMRFLENPRLALGEAAMDAVAAIGERMDLDYAGVDFSILPDGRVLVFEANATMLVHPEADGEFARKNPFIARITDAFQALVERRSRPAQASAPA